MYHSYLVIDTGGNPDRPRPGRKWLNNIYAVHQRLCMGFPTQTKVIDDPFFLAPFNPDAFTNDCSKHNYLHNKKEEPKSNSPNFLFRIENQIHGNQRIAIIGVQSELEPNWEYAFSNAGHLLADGFPIAEPKIYNPDVTQGDILRFRININLSKKISKKDSRDKIRDNFEDIQGKRISVVWKDNEDRDSVIQNWFQGKVDRGNLGFFIKKFDVVKVGWTFGWKHSHNNIKSNTLKFRSALLEGTLEVRNRENLLKTIASGIGSAKAFGFGLFSIKKI